MKKYVTACLVCLSAVATGCGGGGAGNVSDFCKSYSTAINGLIVQCLGAPQDVVDTMFQGADATQCQNMAQAVASKRATYDSKSGQACLDELNGAACTDIPTFGGANDPCSKAVTGTVAAGGSCYTDIDCSPAGFCENVSGTNCPASCSAYVQQGGDCSQGQTCAGGLDCNGTTCVGLATKGQPCGGSGGAACAGGLYCDGTGGNAGVCQTSLAAGGSCTAGSQCQLGLTCANGACAPFAKVGESCSQDSDCGLYTWCNNGSCAEWPTAGGSCGMQGSQSYVGCVSSWCKITNQATFTGTCTAYLKVGDACSTNDYGSCGDAECDNGTCTAACAEK